MKTTKPLYNKKVTEPSVETIMNIKSFARNYVTYYSASLKRNIDSRCGYKWSSSSVENHYILSMNSNKQ